MAQATRKVIDCYDKTAEAYAENFLDELEKKHLDRLLLQAFASETQGPMADFGCGPGQTTRFLKDAGAEQVMGIDISPEAGFTAVDVIERQPYVEAEYPSRRAYIWLEK